MESLTCLRCGAPYEPDATVCLTCGAPIGETQSPTQPVRALKIPKPAPTEPEPPFAPATYSAARSAATATATRAPRKRGWPAVFVVCALLIVVLGGAAYVVHSMTAGPAIAHETLYRDARHRFSFQRPAIWLVTASADGVTLTDAAGVSTAKLTVATPPSGDDATTQASALAKQLALSLDAPQIVAGQTWQQISGDVTGSDGAVRHLDMLVTVYDGQLYTIAFSSPTSSFSGTNNLVYQPLLASFAFS